MTKETNLVSIIDFQNKNNNNVEAASDSIYKLALDSLTRDKVDSLEKSFKVLSESFEAISNAIDLMNRNNDICYNFGRITAITELVLDLIDFESLSSNLEQITKNYPLLLPALQTIKESNTISGSELQKKMNLKSSSNLSNFVKRIDKYELIHVKKIGTTNYFSLTQKGKQLLSQNNETPDVAFDEQIPLKNVHVMLDEISSEIGKINPNTLKIIQSLPSELTTKEKRLLKHKIDIVFNSSEKFKISKIKRIFNTSKNTDYTYIFETKKPSLTTYESKKNILEGHYV